MTVRQTKNSKTNEKRTSKRDVLKNETTNEISNSNNSNDIFLNQNDLQVLNHKAYETINHAQSNNKLIDKQDKSEFNINKNGKSCNNSSEISKIDKRDIHNDIKTNKKTQKNQTQTHKERRTNKERQSHTNKVNDKDQEKQQYNISFKMDDVASVQDLPNYFTNVSNRLQAVPDPVFDHVGVRTFSTGIIILKVLGTWRV